MPFCFVARIFLMLLPV